MDVIILPTVGEQWCHNVLDPHVELVVREHVSRAMFGREKYGVTTDRDDLAMADWLVHFQHESMDAAVYAQRIRYEFQTIADSVDTLANLLGSMDDISTPELDAAIQVVGEIQRRLKGTVARGDQQGSGSGGARTGVDPIRYTLRDRGADAQRGGGGQGH